MAHALAAPPLAEKTSSRETISDVLLTSNWTAVSEGLWACNSGGNFLGSVEFTAGGFEAVDGRGTALGRSHSLAGAKKLVEGQPAETYTDVLNWRDDRRAFAIAWSALLVSAFASVTLAVQLFT